jgi:ADP-heptose:LPS heptosyltransferase
MRRIDRWLGVSLCFLLTVVRFFVSKFHNASIGPVRRILFVKLAEQGATVVAYPAILKVVERVGRENVYFIVFEKNRYILDIMEVVPAENIITIPTQGLFGVMVGFLRAIRHIRRIKIDTAIDFEFFSRASALICWLSGARRRIGLHSFAGEAPYRGNLMTHPIPYNCHVHTSDMYRILIESTDAPTRTLPALKIAGNTGQYCLPKLCPHPWEVKELKQLLHKETGLDDISSIILLNANAGDLLPCRCWPTQNYVELARRLIDKYPDVCVVFTGAPKEASVAQSLAAEVVSDRCTCLAGKTTFRQLIVLYAISDAIVTNDSGPAHFAALTPINIIVLFGPETPILFAPMGPRVHVINAALACSPCVSAFNNRQTRCRDNLCMQAITVDEVFTKTCQVCVLSIVKDRPAPMGSAVCKVQSPIISIATKADTKSRASGRGTLDRAV